MPALNRALRSSDLDCLMGKDKDSTTLVLVCRKCFRQIIEPMLKREGIDNFRHGDLNLIGGPAVSARIWRGASHVFIVTTSAGSARRLLDILAACPIRVDSQIPFELYTVGD